MFRAFPAIRFLTQNLQLQNELVFRIMKKFFVYALAACCVLTQSCSQLDIDTEQKNENQQNGLDKIFLDMSFGGSEEEDVKDTRIGLMYGIKAKKPDFYWERGNRIMVKDVSYDHRYYGYSHDTLVIDNNPQNDKYAHCSGYVHAKVNDEVRMFYPHDFKCRNKYGDMLAVGRENEYEAINTAHQTILKLDISGQNGSFSKDGKFTNELMYMRSLRYSVVYDDWYGQYYLGRYNKITGKLQKLDPNNSDDRFYPLVSIGTFRFYDTNNKRINLKNAQVTVLNQKVKALYNMDEDPIDLNPSSGASNPEMEYTETKDLIFTTNGADDANTNYGDIDLVFFPDMDRKSIDFLLMNNPGTEDVQFYEGSYAESSNIRLAGKFIGTSDGWAKVKMKQQPRYKVGYFYNRDGSISEEAHFPVGIVFALSMTKDGPIDPTLTYGPHCRIIALEDLANASGNTEFLWCGSENDVAEELDNVVGTTTDICGRDNIESLFNYCKQMGDYTIYEQACLAHNYAPKDRPQDKGQWYLPSVGELSCMTKDVISDLSYSLQALSDATLFGYSENGTKHEYYNYWTSTASNKGRAFFYNPNNYSTTLAYRNLKWFGQAPSYHARAILSK